MKKEGYGKCETIFVREDFCKFAKEFEHLIYDLCYLVAVLLSLQVLYEPLEYKLFKNRYSLQLLDQKNLENVF